MANSFKFSSLQTRSFKYVLWVFQRTNLNHQEYYRDAWKLTNSHQVYAVWDVISVWCLKKGWLSPHEKGISLLPWGETGEKNLSVQEKLQEMREIGKKLSDVFILVCKSVMMYRKSGDREETPRRIFILGGGSVMTCEPMYPPNIFAWGVWLIIK